jgi:hypothetical protein
MQVSQFSKADVTSPGDGRPGQSAMRSHLVLSPSPKKSMAAQAAAIRVSKAMQARASERYTNPSSPERSEEEEASLDTGLAGVEECTSPNPIITPTPARFPGEEGTDLGEQRSSSAKRQLVFSKKPQEEEPTWEEETFGKSPVGVSRVVSFSEVGTALAEDLELAVGDVVDGADDDPVYGGTFTVESKPEAGFEKGMMAWTEAAGAKEESVMEKVEDKEGMGENGQEADGKEMDGKEADGANEELAASGKAVERDGEKVLEDADGMGDANNQEAFGIEDLSPKGPQGQDAEDERVDFESGVVVNPFQCSSDTPELALLFGETTLPDASSGSPNKSERSGKKPTGTSTTSSQARKRPRAEDDPDFGADSPGPATKGSAPDGFVSWIGSPAEPKPSPKSAIKSPAKKKLLSPKKVTFDIDDSTDTLG